MHFWISERTECLLVHYKTKSDLGVEDPPYHLYLLFLAEDGNPQVMGGGCEL